MASELKRAFLQLDNTLSDSQHLWLPRPFTTDALPWHHTHPHLAAALLALSDDAVAQLHNSPQLHLDWFREREPQLCAALHAFAPQPAVAVRPLALDQFDSLHIPGRKWQQVVAFAAALPQHPYPYVDWCAGKGHLSRIVQRHLQQPVHCMEWDSSLVEIGRALAQRRGCDIHYHHQDVLQALPAACADPDTVHIGLHACGDLHQQLLRHVAAGGARAVAISPCCYHKVASDLYVPLSSAAQASRLRLDRPALHLAVQETVTARRAERPLRELERWWRLSFDALQRELCDTDTYLHVPSCKRELLRADFPAFCRWAARCKQIELPVTIDYDKYLQRGREKHRQIVRLELLRQLFTRPLELWLVLDYALYLEQHGYRVDVAEFCERNVSPRNILIQGRRD
ncbi:MAG: methyltransferase [Halioglobus sp.]|nr:methyltransferase [Halioglobus sp.]